MAVRVVRVIGQRQMAHSTPIGGSAGVIVGDARDRIRGRDMRAGVLYWIGEKWPGHHQPHTSPLLHNPGITRPCACSTRHPVSVEMLGNAPSPPSAADD
jgi:hypothetical protein